MGKLKSEQERFEYILKNKGMLDDIRDGVIDFRKLSNKKKREILNVLFYEEHYVTMEDRKVVLYDRQLEEYLHEDFYVKLIPDQIAIEYESAKAQLSEIYQAS